MSKEVFFRVQYCLLNLFNSGKMLPYVVHYYAHEYEYDYIRLWLEPTKP